MKNPQDHSSHSISRRKFIGSSSLAGLSVLTFPNAARGTSANETSSSSTDEGASANPTATNCKASYTPPTNAEAMYTEM